MRSLYKTFIFLTLSLLIFSCGDAKNLTDNYTITTSKKKNAVANGQEISFSLKAKKTYPIDSIVYSLDAKKLATTTQAIDYKATAQSTTLGRKILTATIYTSKGTTTATGYITILHTKAPKIYGYKIINRYPHKTDAYTQGLEFVGDTLYESTGRYGSSSLRKVDYKTGEVLQQIDLDDAYFAEGLTVFNGNIYQLTWKENVDGKAYKLSTLNDAQNYVLVFWSTGCSHCLREIPVLYKHTQNKKKIKVIAFSLENNDKDWKKHIVKYPKWHNAIGLNKWENPIARTYQIFSTPTYIVLDKNKKIIAKPNTLEEVRKIVEYLEK